MLHAVPTDYQGPRHGGRAGWLRKDSTTVVLGHGIPSALSPCAAPVRISRKARLYHVEVGTADARSRHFSRLMSASSYAKAAGTLTCVAMGFGTEAAFQLGRIAIFGFLSR